MGEIIKFPIKKKQTKNCENIGEDILEVAKFFLYRKPMTLRKLQTLCYLAQCHYIGMYHHSLMNATFEAWANGPSSRELYEKYSEWEHLDIVLSQRPTFKNEDCEEYLNTIFCIYGRLSEKKLKKLIEKDNVWMCTRMGFKKREPCIEKIRNETIYDNYKNMHLAY